MSTHDKNLFTMTVISMLLVTANFLAVVTGNAEAIYAPVNELMQSLMSIRGS